MFGRNLNETCEGIGGGGGGAKDGRERGGRGVGSGNCTGEKRKKREEKKGRRRENVSREEARFLSDQTGDSMADCSASGTHVDPPAFFRDAWLPAPLKHAHPVFRKQKGATRGDEALWAHPLLDHGA